MSRRACPGGLRAHPAGTSPRLAAKPIVRPVWGMMDMRSADLLVRATTGLLAWLVALTACARAQDPTPARLEVFPPDVSLWTSRGRQTFVVQATQADGITRDVTA